MLKRCGKPGRRPLRIAVTALVISAAVATVAPAALALQNNGGGTSMGDILAQGYKCIAQNPKTGMVWCVRGQDEPGYVCTPDGACYPVPPSPTPPWAVRANPLGTIRPPATILQIKP